MARVEKNAAGEDVRVDTEEFGCVTIEPAKSGAASAKPTTKSTGSKDAAPESDEGDN